MKSTATSRTAQYMALFRAMETTRPQNKRLFTDRFAYSFLDNGLKAGIWLCRIPGLRAVAESIIRKRIPGAMSSGIARTRYIDDLLQQSIQQGVQQVMILGAGFDTRALRLPFLHDIPVIEIDHPNTARYKLARLAQYKIPPRIRYYQIDFNQQSLEELGLMHHFDYSLRTTIIWEGVTNYLEQEAVDQTFTFLQRFPAGSAVIFTYVEQAVLENPAAFYGASQLLQDVSELEEKWTFGIRPELLRSYLSPFGFSLEEDLGANAYRERYLPERTEKGYEFYRVAMAVRKED
ncbi:class I SAM-dependent methyltransferase [Chitinophaga nivalis]|uniref:S-adenosyl-L-methionine-dependent methyltransferase n=1 Tax=Chitinophaga nivalis TaxID=2991709 RepID=A0ABT3ILF1_9BACT|nr:SAM-dependent methyltransferase [Chitinophaga nivalis]MCW3465508.1 SAM-dependent methyltransferase [Chitinophaga nivalis]MCW3484801.1 SAM-dependent methyltransferase [Chitinophaga nivalis]